MAADHKIVKILKVHSVNYVYIFQRLQSISFSKDLHLPKCWNCHTVHFERQLYFKLKALYQCTITADFPKQSTFKAWNIHQNMTMCLFHQHFTWIELYMEKSTQGPDVNIQLSKCSAHNLGRCRSFESEISGKRWEL